MLFFCPGDMISYFFLFFFIFIKECKENYPQNIICKSQIKKQTRLNASEKSLDFDWGLEDSDLRTPTWGLRLEDSDLRTPTWGLRLEDSDLRSPTWGLRYEDSDLRTYSNSEFQFRIPIPNSNSEFQFRIPIPNSNSEFQFQFQFWIRINVRKWLQLRLWPWTEELDLYWD